MEAPERIGDADRSRGRTLALHCDTTAAQALPDAHRRVIAVDGAIGGESSAP